MTQHQYVHVPFSLTKSKERSKAEKNNDSNYITYSTRPYSRRLRQKVEANGGHKSGHVEGVARPWPLLLQLLQVMLLLLQLLQLLVHLLQTLTQRIWHLLLLGRQVLRWAAFGRWVSLRVGGAEAVGDVASHQLVYAVHPTHARNHWPTHHRPTHATTTAARPWPDNLLLQETISR